MTLLLLLIIYQFSLVIFHLQPCSRSYVCFAGTKVSLAFSCPFSFRRSIRYIESVTRFTITGFTSLAGPHKLDVGAIAGSVVGGVAFVALVALAAFFYRRRSRNRTRKDGQTYDNVLPYPPGFGTRVGQDARAPPQVEEVNNVSSTRTLVSKTLVTPNSGAREGSSSVPVLSSVAGSSDAGTSRYGAEAELLREEVEHLRREMEEIRLRTTYEPPPEYQ